jgi:very-short-patch-repair endonuclease
VQIAKGDLAYPLYKVVVEHDGWHHERDAAQRQRDHLRRERLEAEGWLVVVITAEDFRNEKSIAWRVYGALRLRGYTGSRPRFGP